MKRELKNVKYFEQWSMNSTDIDIDMIAEGKIADMFKKAGNALVDVVNKIEGNTPVDRIKKMVSNPKVLNLIAKNSGYSTDELKNALVEGDKVKWVIDKISNDKIKEIVTFLYKLGKEKYDTAKAETGGEFGK